jgi:hypothetical protein
MLAVDFVVTPHLVANTGLRALRAAIADPGTWAVEPKVDGVRGLVVYGPGRTLETRNRRGERRDWLRGTASKQPSGDWRIACRSCGTAPSSTGS